MIIKFRFPPKADNPKKRYQMDIGHGWFDTYGRDCNTFYDQCSYLPEFSMSDKPIEGWLQGYTTTDHMACSVGAYSIRPMMTLVYGGIDKLQLRGVGFTCDHMYIKLPFHEKHMQIIKRYDDPKIIKHIDWSVNENYLGRSQFSGTYDQLEEKHLDAILLVIEAASKKLTLQPQ